MTGKTVPIAAIAGLILFARIAAAECPVERAPVKTVTDRDASAIRPLPMPATIESLRALPAVRPLPQDRRVVPTETTIYSVTATLVAYRLTPAGEIHLVLSDELRRTITAIIPSPACLAGSRFLSEITAARAAFDRRYAAANEFTEVRKAVQVQGVGYFDFLQGQRGIAPNGLSLHPVIAIDFTPSLQPKAPPPATRRRAVGRGGARTCPRPLLSIATSSRTACTGETVTLTWQTSDAAARVDIDGLGVALPASGSRTISAVASSVYSGRATNACGASDEALAVISLVPAATASLHGPSSVITGNRASLSVSVSGVTSWSLTSSLGNSIQPNAGASSGTVTYNASRSGTDTVTLRTAGGACGNVTQTLVIVVSEPQNLGLRCCDGTRSPSCFNCNDKRGCCSSHGGVCGCP